MLTTAWWAALVTLCLPGHGLSLTELVSWFLWTSLLTVEAEYLILRATYLTDRPPSIMPIATRRSSLLKRGMVVSFIVLAVIKIMSFRMAILTQLKYQTQILSTCRFYEITSLENDWPEGYQLAGSMNFRFPQCVPTHLKTLIPNASNEAIALMRDMLQWDPKKRPTAIQALRYPYFQVGQVLGPPPQYVEQQNAQNKPVQPTEPKPISLSKTEPHSPPEPIIKVQPKVNHQPLQQIQLPQQISNQPGLPKMTYKQHQPYLPTTNKNPPFKPAAAGNENNIVGSKSGRRRWGQTILKTSDSWDEFDDSDIGVSYSKKPSIGSMKEKINEESLFRSAEQNPSNAYGTGNRVSSNTTVNRIESGVSNSSSARQHYLRQSRYLPGINPKNSSVVVGNKESSQHLWGNSSTLISKPLGPIGGGMSINRANAAHFGGTNYNSGVYIPSFQKKEVGSAGQRIQLATLGAPSAMLRTRDANSKAELDHHLQQYTSDTIAHTCYNTSAQLCLQLQFADPMEKARLLCF
ncbi:UNVERIFIED_CONTAM: hypothetical protein FKN15_038845 [Acipenser sinensis]